MSLEELKVDGIEPIDLEAKTQEQIELETMYEGFIESLGVFGYDFEAKLPDISKLNRTILIELYDAYMNGLDEEDIEYIKQLPNFKKIVSKMTNYKHMLAQVGSGSPENYAGDPERSIKECKEEETKERD